jgi:small subunit ribosomal protein S3Ae
MGKKFGKKGSKKKVVDAMSRKEWYSLRVPVFTDSGIKDGGSTLVNKSAGTKIASEELKGRVFERISSDLAPQREQTLGCRKMQFIIEEVQNQQAICDYYGAAMTRHFICSKIKKWHSIIEAHADGKTTDGYHVRLFCIAFTDKQIIRNGDKNNAYNNRNSGETLCKKKTCYVQTSAAKKIRAVMIKVMQDQVKTLTLAELMRKFNNDEIVIEIDTQTRPLVARAKRIGSLQNTMIRKIKVIKRPHYDVTRLMALHSATQGVTSADHGERIANLPQESTNTLTSDVRAQQQVA